MKIVFAFGVYALSLNLLAQISTVEQGLEVPSKVEALLNPAGQVACEPQKDPCEDLFGAACLNKDQDIRSIGIEKKMDEKIRAAQEDAIAAMGEENFKKALVKVFEKANLRLKSDISDDEFDTLLTVSDDPEVMAFLPEYPKDCSVLPLDFADDLSKRQNEYQTARSNLDFYTANIEGNQKKLEELKKVIATSQDALVISKATGELSAAQAVIKYYSENLEKQKAEAENTEKSYGELLKRREEIVNAQSEKYEKETLGGFVKNPVATSLRIMTLCSTEVDNLKKSQEEEAKKNKPDPELLALNFSSLCDKKSLYDLKFKTSQWIRLKELSDKISFAEKIILPLKDQLRSIWDFNQNRSQFGSPTYGVIPEGAIKESGKKFRQYQSLCTQAKSQAATRFREVRQEFLKNIALSQPVVESIISHTYGDEKKKVIEGIFSEARSGVMNFIDQELSQLPGIDPKKISQIKEGMGKLNYFWAQNPDSTHYKKVDDFPLPIIDLEKDITNDFLENFNDAELSGFKALNASYSPEIRVGAYDSPEIVQLLPAVNLMAEEDPMGVMMVFAHEVGHKIGPKISWVNGYDLSKDYADLLTCLSQDSSINMKSNQSDEVLADWISAKVLGKYILRQPEAKRKELGLRVAGFFCEVRADSFYKSAVTPNEDHPETMLRINGIFGANSDIRTALSCDQNKPSPVKECKLKDNK